MITLAEIKEYCSDAVIANGDYHEMAALVNAGYQQYEPKEVGDGAVSIALGMPDGPLFLLQLEQLSNMPTEAADLPTLVKIAMCRQVWRSLITKSFDIGNKDVRAAVDSMVGIVITAPQATAIKAIAPVISGGFSWEQIREVVEGGI